MLKKRSWIPSYCDGVAEFYHVPASRTDFGAQLNPTTTADMELACTVAFIDSAMRNKDFEFAQQRGMNVERKIRTHRAPGIDADCKCVIGTTIYDVSYVDATRTDLFIYLEGGRTFGDA